MRDEDGGTGGGGKVGCVVGLFPGCPKLLGLLGQLVYFRQHHYGASIAVHTGRAVPGQQMDRTPNLLHA